MFIRIKGFIWEQELSLLGNVIILFLYSIAAVVDDESGREIGSCFKR